MAFDWGSLLSGAADVYGAYENYNAARGQGSAARSAAEATQVHPYSGYSPYGSTTFNNQTGQFSINPASNPFQSMFQGLGLSSLANAGVANSQPFYGANPEIINALHEANGASQIGSPQYQQILDQLRGVAAPQEQRDRVSLDNQQFARGQLGTSGGAARYQALMEAQGQNDLQRQLMAGDTASSRAQQRFSNALTTVNQGMSGQQQQYNIGSGAFNGTNNIFTNLLNQAQLGIPAGGGQAPSAAMYAAQMAGAPNLANAQAVTGIGNLASQYLGRYFNPVQEYTPTAQRAP